MDIKQPATEDDSPEKSEAAVRSSSLDHEQILVNTPSPARTYECTFCKRGFSNAQALGGHMNIHRKDKAKLKKATHEPQQQQQFFEISKPIINPNISVSTTIFGAKNVTPLAVVAGDHHERSKKWAWNFSTSSELLADDEPSRSPDHHQVTRHQLPLFNEEVTISNPTNNVNDYKESVEQDDEDDDDGGGGGDGDELDLELRLGHHDPHSKSSSTEKGTRKFFGPILFRLFFS